MNIKKMIIISSIVLVGLITYFSITGSYNKMVYFDENIEQAWAQVENVYQRRSDLIPNLVNIVQGYADFEKSTLTDIIDARSKATSVNIDPNNLTPEKIQEFQAAQSSLGSTLSRLMMVVEKYPYLKANQGFLQLQTELEGTENRIAVERKKFNEVVQSYNKYIRRFPSNIMAGMFGFDAKEYFKADEGANKAPIIKFSTKMK